MLFRAECYDYLFEIALQMKQMGLDPTAKPNYASDAYLSAVHRNENNPNSNHHS